MISRMILGMLSLSFTASAMAEELYHCEVKANGSTVESFTFDPTTEANKFIEINAELAAGCLYFQSVPPLLSCSLGGLEGSYATAIAPMGVQFLTLHARVEANDYLLRCDLR
jgi:hypothetical protein